MTEITEDYTADSLSWTTPVQEIKDISEARAQFLIKKGYATVGDLLLRIPLRLVEPSPPFSEFQTAQGLSVGVCMSGK